jgi:hypothetical protein
MINDAYFETIDTEYDDLKDFEDADQFKKNSDMYGEAYAIKRVFTNGFHAGYRTKVNEVARDEH